MHSFICQCSNGPRSFPCPSAVLGTGQSSGCCWHTSPQAITSFRAMTTPPSPCPSAAPARTPGRSCAMGKVARRLGRAGFLLAPGNTMGAGREGTTLSSCLKRAPRRQAPSLTRQGWTGCAGPHPWYGKLICGMRLLVLGSGTTPWEEGEGRRRGRRKAFLARGSAARTTGHPATLLCAPRGHQRPSASFRVSSGGSGALRASLSGARLAPCNSPTMPAPRLSQHSPGAAPPQPQCIPVTLWSRAQYHQCEDTSSRDRSPARSHEAPAASREPHQTHPRQGPRLSVSPLGPRHLADSRSHMLNARQNLLRSEERNWAGGHSGAGLLLGGGRRQAGNLQWPLCSGGRGSRPVGDRCGHQGSGQVSLDLCQLGRAHHTRGQGRQNRGALCWLGGGGRAGWARAGHTRRFYVAALEFCLSLSFLVKLFENIPRAAESGGKKCCSHLGQDC